MEFGNNRADLIDPEYLNLKYILMKVGSYTFAYKWKTLLLQTPIGMEVTHKVDRSEASMTNLPQVCEELLGILPEEQLSHLRVLQAPGPHTRRHGQRLDSMYEILVFNACYQQLRCWNSKSIAFAVNNVKISLDRILAFNIQHMER